MYAPCCAVLPPGDLMVAGGWTGDTEDHYKRMWIGNINVHVVCMIIINCIVK